MEEAVQRVAVRRVLRVPRGGWVQRVRVVQRALRVPRGGWVQRVRGVQRVRWVHRVRVVMGIGS